MKQYGCGPIKFTGSGDALYERHLMFDDVVDPAEVGPRERYEAIARSVRDVLSQRWHRTEHTYDRENPKRVYYLSMEFLIGRSLSNNILNLRLDPIARRFLDEKQLDGLAILEEEPDAGLGNGGLGRLAACFLNSMATMQLPAMGYGLRYEYGIFKQIDRRTAGSANSPTTGCAIRIPGKSRDRRRWWKSSSAARSRCRAAVCGRYFGRPSSLLGMPFDRPVVGYGGKTINTLRLWAAATPRRFRFPGVQRRRVRQRAGRAARRRVGDPRSLSRQLDQHGPGAALRAGIFSRRLLAGRPDTALPPRAMPIGARCPTRWRSSSTTPTRRSRFPELMRILLDEAGLGWDEAWDLTRRTLAYTNHTLLPEALEKWPLRWFEVLLPRQLEIVYEINRRLVDRGAKPFSGR